MDDEAIVGHNADLVQGRGVVRQFHASVKDSLKRDEDVRLLCNLPECCSQKMGTSARHTLDMKCRKFTNPSLDREYRVTPFHTDPDRLALLSRSLPYPLGLASRQFR